MCKILKISRNSIYYKPKPKIIDTKLENAVITEFNGSKKCYGTRKLKVIILKNHKIVVSRRKIGVIMQKYELISKYTLKKFKCRKNKCNEEKIPNLLNQNFKNKKMREVVVSDSTYVNIGSKWHYICLFTDLANREIIGFAASDHNNSNLVKSAFYSIEGDLRKIDIFHTDRGSEFKNFEIDALLKAFKIRRSLSKKACPYDNAVAEANFNILKTEFIYGEKFKSLADLQFRLFDYVKWFNNHRIHGSLNYLTPAEFKLVLSHENLY